MQDLYHQQYQVNVASASYIKKDAASRRASRLGLREENLESPIKPLQNPFIKRGLGFRV